MGKVTSRRVMWNRRESPASMRSRRSWHSCEWECRPVAHSGRAPRADECQLVGAKRTFNLVRALAHGRIDDRRGTLSVGFGRRSFIAGGGLLRDSLLRSKKRTVAHHRYRVATGIGGRESTAPRSRLQRKDRSHARRSQRMSQSRA